MRSGGLGVVVHRLGVVRAARPATAEGLRARLAGNRAATTVATPFRQGTRQRNERERVVASPMPRALAASRVFLTSTACAGCTGVKEYRDPRELGERLFE